MYDTSLNYRLNIIDNFSSFLKMSSNSDVESDEEETKRIKEAAVDISGLHNGKSVTAGSCFPIQLGNVKQQQLPSKRSDQGKEQEVEHELQTTPEFRYHVAKKLSQIIDSAIKVKPKWSENVKSERNDTGIQLFSSSGLVSDVQIDISHGKQQQKMVQKKRICSQHSSSSDTSDEDEADFASVAVSGHSIISEGSLQKLYQNDLKASSVHGNSDKVNSDSAQNESDKNFNGLSKKPSLKKKHKKRKHCTADC